LAAAGSEIVLNGFGKPEEQTNTLLCPCAADEARSSGTTTGEFSGNLQRIGDGARQVFARHFTIG
jgi:hypothetical protein